MQVASLLQHHKENKLTKKKKERKEQRKNMVARSQFYITLGPGNQTAC